MRNPSFYLKRPIYSLQTMLRLISDTDSRILPLIPNGLYSANTHASVRSFQEVYGLPVTGETDLRTWQTIAAVFHSIRFRYRDNRTMIVLSENDLLYAQTVLAALSSVFENIRKPEITGTSDSITQSSLAMIQTVAGLSPTGHTDPDIIYILSVLNNAFPVM